MTSRIKRVEQSIAISSKQQLLDLIFEQLSQLQEMDSITFTICADKHTHEPRRIVLLSEVKG